MGTPTIKTKIAMDGEKEYKQAVKDVGAGLKVLDSEMKLVTAQFAENEKSVEALSAKNDVLERQLLSQKEKIETLKDALKNAADGFGEADSRTMHWQSSLYEAESELIKIERKLLENKAAIESAADAAADADSAYDSMADALGENSEAAEENVSILDKLSNAFGGAEGEGKSLGDMLDDLAGKLGISLPDGAKDAINALGDVDAKTALLAGTAAGAAAMIFKIEEALAGITQEQAEYATSISNISQIINMSVESTQQWDYVLKTVGSSIEEAQGDLSAFQERIMDAASGAGEAAEMFAKLGVNVIDQNGNLRDTQSVLLDTIHALQIMADETERNAISSSLLGGTGEKLIPIYNQSAESLDYLLQKKKELGILTGDEIEALKAVSEATIDYQEKIQDAKNSLAVEFAPALESFIEQAGTSLKDLGQAAEDSGLVNFFGSILDLVTSLAPLIGLLSSAFQVLTPVLETASIALGAVSDAVSIVTNGIALLGELILNGPLALLGIGEVDIDQYLDNIAGLRNNSATKRAWTNAFNASGNYNFDGGYTWVGENGPELAYLPQGTRIFNNQESREMGGDIFYVTIDAKNVKEFNDIVEMARTKRRRDRMG